MSSSRPQEMSMSSALNSSDQIYCQQDLWYFKNREGDEIGPFRYRSEAQSNLQRFMEQLEATVQSTRKS